jgi:hypothetical protein
MPSDIAKLKQQFPAAEPLQEINSDYIAYSRAIVFRAREIALALSELRDLVNKKDLAIQKEVQIPANFTPTSARIATEIFSLYPDIYRVKEADGSPETGLCHNSDAGQKCCDFLYEGAQELGINKNDPDYRLYLSLVAINLRKLGIEAEARNESAI